jgi:RNA polymerase sigma-70 factor, ECF subfamily
LVARCRRGDHTAWRALYDRHAPTVYRFLAALGIPPGEREDACQDVFVAVYRSLARFRGEARLSTWIYRIAARGAGRSLQRRRLQSLLSTLLMREPPPPPEPDPSERTARIELLDDLVGRLSPKKRLVLVLFEIEELPVDEIAKIAGCPENTVWSRLHHARADLAEMAKRRLR